jgi:aspartyl-tRNA(Asn)/glutamyl-tRNA(Gln) amidotransferase subunit A
VTAPVATGSDVIRLTAAQTAAAVASGDISAVETTQAHLDRIGAVDERVHAFLHVDAEGALAAAKAVDDRRAAGERLGPLAGVPLAMKDVVATRGLPTTCGSRILEGWIPPYDATVVRRLREAGVVILGKTNMDEFAMGSSTEHSAYGPTHNPWDLSRIPGGSGGGSAAAVAAFEAPIAVGTDTGGSIRQPAAVTGTVGVKPTYGGVSRYGLVALASSLDQAGPCARTVLDAALLHATIAGHDPLDSTSIDAPVPAVVEAARAGDVTGMRVGVVKQFSGEGYQPGVLQRFREAVEVLEGLGASVVEVDCPHFDYALPAYYLILPSECSSNLARFEGMRYGLRVGDDGEHSAEEVMARTREAGFGAEAKRRIMLGTYALSSGYYDAYYGQAQKVRTLIVRDFAAAFEKVDVLVSPTTPTTAFPIGERIDDPLAMYLADLCTIPSNLAGNASMSLPVGLSPDDGLPVGLQVIAPPLADDRLYRVGAALEAALRDRWGHLLIEEAPAL